MIPYQQVVVFVGHLLSQLLVVEDEDEDEKILPAVHCVTKSNQPRLSLVYELRPRNSYIFQKSIVKNLSL